MSTKFIERDALCAPGFPVLFLSLALIAMGAYGGYLSFGPTSAALPVLAVSVLIGLAGFFVLNGLYVNAPNECSLFLFFGDYAGVDRTPGMRWTNPLYNVRKANLRTQTLITPTLKVNDERGNPIEIAAAVIWHIDDAASAVFGLDNIQTFLASTVESTVREIASIHPYDHADIDDPRETTLRGHVSEISAELSSMLSARMASVGGAIAIVDAKLTHLAYAPEIASAMLRRQQAEAIVGARKTIVLGAVTMVDEALRALDAKGIQLDDERRAAMVGNLLVVLCADREATPVINAGGLY